MNNLIRRARIDIQLLGKLSVLNGKWNKETAVVVKGIHFTIWKKSKQPGPPRECFLSDHFDILYKIKVIVEDGLFFCTAQSE